MSLDYVALGRQIERYRRSAGYTQEELAEMCDISVSHMSRIENGRRRPSLEMLVSIAGRLHASMSDLISDAKPGENLEMSDEIMSIFKDCTEPEQRLLCDIALSVKNHIRTTGFTQT